MVTFAPPLATLAAALLADLPKPGSLKPFLRVLPVAFKVFLAPLTSPLRRFLPTLPRPFLAIVTAPLPAVNFNAEAIFFPPGIFSRIGPSNLPKKPVDSAEPLAAASVKLSFCSSRVFLERSRPSLSAFLKNAAIVPKNPLRSTSRFSCSRSLVISFCSSAESPRTLSFLAL